MFCNSPKPNCRLLILLGILLFFGCAPENHISDVREIEETLYLKDRDNGILKIFNIKNEKFTHLSIKNPYRIIGNENNLIVQEVNEIKYKRLGASPYFSSSDNYTLKDGLYAKLATMPQKSELLCADDEFVYAINHDQGTAKFYPIKISISGKNTIGYHLIDKPDKYVIDIWQENGRFWYLCLSALDFKPPFGLGGKISLIEKSQNKTNEYDFDGKIHYGVGLVGGDSDIWVYSSPSSGRNYTIKKYKVGLFSKEKNVFILMK